MSDPGRRPRQWRFYLQDMTNFAERVLSYTNGMDQSTFITNRLTYDATLRNIELIGEAATHIPVEVRQANPQIPWRAIIGARNRIIHGYLGIDDDTIWTIVQDAIPELLKQLRELTGYCE